MSRPIRIQYAGALYHIMARGNERCDIFHQDEDYELFLEILLEIITRYNWLCFSYCLMPNHYHLLLKTREANLSIGMRQLNGKYSQRFNIKNKRVGHLFQGRFKSILVEEEFYKNKLIRYIVLNPVRAKLVTNIEDWFWSSHVEVIGKRNKKICSDINELLKGFSEVKKEAIQIYLDYIYEKLDEKDFLSFENNVILGSDNFINSVKKYFKEQKKEYEIPKKERLAYRPKLDKLFLNNKLDLKNRNRLIYKAHMSYGYSLSEISKELNLHYSSIGKIINRKFKI